MKTVLLIEDNSESARTFRSQLEADVRLLVAPSIAVARDLYFSTPHISLVTIGSFEGVATITFVRWLRQRGYAGIIVAATPFRTTNDALLTAGGTTAVNRNGDVVTEVRRRLRSVQHEPV